MFDEIDTTVVAGIVTVLFGLSALGCLLPPCGPECGGGCEEDAAVADAGSGSSTCGSGGSRDDDAGVDEPDTRGDVTDAGSSDTDAR